MEPSSSYVFRFGDFELDVQAYELRRKGRRVRLERQPMDLLILLVERRRELVTREDIVARLWGQDVFVDVETGINTAIRKIRQALNDSPDRRRSGAVVETVSGKGYRFASDIVVIPDTDAAAVMLAVLPFVNLSADAERDYLADGLTEDAIATLSQIDPVHLRVIGRTSAMAYKGTHKSLATIGAELKAQFLVEGSIRSDGPALRIRCTLNRVADQAQLWSASYDRDMTGLAGVPRDLAAAVAEQIHLQLSPGRMASVAERQSRDAAAYDAYLRGRRFWNQLTPATTRKAVEYYTRATTIDPGYALAWAGLAEAFASAPINGDAEPLFMWPRAREAAAKAVEANPNLAEVQHVCGQVNWFFEWDWPAAVTAYRRAIVLDPSSAWSHSMLGHLLSQLGRHDEGRPFMERACALEPMSPLHYAMASQVAFQARDFETARQRARQAIVIDPEFWVGHMMFGQACEQLGEVDVALDALATATRLSDGNSKPVGLRGYILATRGQISAARDVLSLLTDLARVRYVPPFAMALVHAGLGEDEQVFEALNRAYAVRDVHLAFLTVDTKWDRYRSEPEFVALLARCAFERESRAGVDVSSVQPPPADALSERVTPD
jgi:TolB-like protein/Flp pilus assembly protein TadD